MIYGSKNDDGVINLRGDSVESEEPEFMINRNVGGSDYGSSEEEELPAPKHVDDFAANAKDKVKVKFDKFVTLVATRAYDHVLDKHADEDVVISTDLLADLASSGEDSSGSKWPLILLIGMMLGVLVTWFVLNN